MTNLKIKVPFIKKSFNEWPALEKSYHECYKQEKHRLYPLLDVPCPCGPIPLLIEKEGQSIQVREDDILFFKDGKERFRLSALFGRIKALEEKIDELKNS